MKTIKLLVILFTCVFCFNQLNSQTLFVPSGTGGIGTSNKSGSVGIGIAAPRAYLDVYPLGINSLKSVLARLGEGDGTGEGTFLGVRAYNSQAENNAPCCNIKSFSIEHLFYGKQNSSVNFYRGGGVIGGFITFNTNDNSERMRIDVSGNVGIGTLAPAYKLDIDNAKYGAGQIRWRGVGSSTSVYGHTYADAGGIGITNADPYSELVYLNTLDHSINLYSLGNIRLKLTSDGNVGIGTEKPTNLQGWARVLDVNGSVNSKIVASSVGDSYKTGMYSHNSWHGGGGFVGTESNHNFFIISNYTPRMAVLTNGNILIGKTSQSNSAYKLDVAGKIRADEIIVNTTGADFVFDPSYNLRSLSEVEAFIKENKHLPEITSAKEMQENGVSAGEMQTKLLQKIEELTLYVIEQNKKIEYLEKDNVKLKEDSYKALLNQQKTLLDLKAEIEELRHKNLN